MINISSIFTLFTVLSGVLILGSWSNIQAYAQQSPSPTQLTTRHSTTISSAVKAKMCAPGSQSLNVVNTTEARICGIPKTVKSNTTTAAIPSLSTTGVSSPTTKLPAANVAAPKQQKITTTPATSQIPKQTLASKETTTGAPSKAPIRNVSNKPSLSSSSTIAPQVNGVNNKHQQQEQLPPTATTVTAVLNHTFARTSPAVTPGTLTSLGYQGSDTAGGSSSASKDKHSSDTKSSSSHNGDDGKSSSPSSIINDISSVIKKSFNYKHSRHSDSSDVVSYFSGNSFDYNFPYISNDGVTANASSSAIAGGASAAASASAGVG
jgi:hypothetical protein